MVASLCWIDRVWPPIGHLLPHGLRLAWPAPVNATPIHWESNKSGDYASQLGYSKYGCMVRIACSADSVVRLGLLGLIARSADSIARTACSKPAWL